ncbi:hypothetical protein GA284_01950 [Staphylococcus pseudintermedius]|uniref:Phage protein n=4 Tax=root TaxID=1 RepID=A0A494W9W8_9CAUD|nr:hypothetical protein [Staphylococcus pseudintermedius]YP_010081581.1 hypothetical protein KMD08_gp27 [Staphylococcus phage phiSP44-1]YP_010081864.1 hypothetical protein KMD12_gp35 [Staphylococcus phage SP276]AZB66568.1 hypothetical protein [Staphylococcus phage phiSP38-1]AZB66644.1 hypothetical protein [Staphylococcus phage phiSP44-1]EGQ1274860.1 hypothetical protein [Staphylococcus pseudintermedius]EGQ2717914.1 hypothetical protein [Staphylococcus pseudintermedius]EGQ2722867.1 hypothetic
MTVLEMKEFLGDLYRSTYKDDTLIQINLVQMGWAIERLLVNERINPFDDYDEVSRLIYDEIDFKQRSKHEKTN